MLLGRYTCGESAWKRETEPDCPLCREKDSIPHIIGCPNLQDCCYEKKEILWDLYRKEGLRAPRSSSELVSAVLNGDRYLTEDGEVVKIKLTTRRAHLTASAICQQIHIERDIQIGNILVNDLEITLPYEDEATPCSVAEV